MAERKPDDLTFYGTATLTATGALTMPIDARKALEFAPEATVLVFGSPSRREAIIAASPAPGALLEAVTRANREGDTTI